jgi:hypothetical protein
MALAALFVLPAPAGASGLSVELWTDRGTDGVYQPGDPIQIKARTSDDAYLLVYEIDAEGGVNLLYPLKGQDGRVQGKNTYRLPESEHEDLVVDSQTGEGYIVAIASDAPFDDLPSYLRPWDPQAEELGFVGKPDDEEGITADGKIVGDPFVAMERIRRRVLRDPSHSEDFGTAYANYYVHERVRYPRYLCNDCHRPGRYAWWDGWDPYYTTCSVFDFRVNWSWGWGPRYWFGSVPYYMYVYRSDCPPRYRHFYESGHRYSSWDGWNRWHGLWGDGALTRYKSPPPANYVPPARYREAIQNGRPIRDLPPGFIAGDYGRRSRTRGGVGLGSGPEVGGDGRRAPNARPGSDDRPHREFGNGRPQGEDVGNGRGRGDDGSDRPRREIRSGESSRNPQQYVPRQERNRGNDDSRGSFGRPAEPPRESPRYERPREERREAPRYERSRDEGRSSPPQQRVEPRREERRETPREERRAPAQKDNGGQRREDRGDGGRSQRHGTP